MANPKIKIKKLNLKEYDARNNTWTMLLPRTTGDMVIGRVNNSRKLDGKTADEFMPSKSDEAIILTDTNGETQAIAVQKIVVGEDYSNMLERTQNGELYVQGEAFAENGKKLVTQEYVQHIVSSLQEEINRLKNDKPYIISEDEPITKNKVWIKNNHAYIFDNEAWIKISG